MAPVNFMFNRLGCVTLELSDTSADTVGSIIDIALENGATDYNEAIKETQQAARFWVRSSSFQVLTGCHRFLTRVYS